MKPLIKLRQFAAKAISLNSITIQRVHFGKKQEQQNIRLNHQEVDCPILKEKTVSSIHLIYRNQQDSHNNMSTVKSKRAVLPPINLIFKYLQQQSLVTIWLYEQTQLRIQGKIRGFDEFMNVVVDEAVEISTSSGSKEELGRILLKGDNITLISSLDV